MFPQKIEFDGNKYRTNEYNKVLDLIYQQTNELRAGKKENGESFSTFSVSVPRPGIEPGWVAPLVFETSASTDSAIWAILNCDAKVVLFFYVANKNSFFLKKSFIYLPINAKRSNFASRLLSAHYGHMMLQVSESAQKTQSSQLVGHGAKRVSAESIFRTIWQRSINE